MGRGVSGLMFGLSITPSLPPSSSMQWPYPMAVAAMGMGVSGFFGFIYCDILKMVAPVDMDANFYITRVLPIGALQAREGKTEGDLRE